jgi:hypothetical protein
VPGPGGHPEHSGPHRSAPGGGNLLETSAIRAAAANPVDGSGLLRIQKVRPALGSCSTLQLVPRFPEALMPTAGAKL